MKRTNNKASENKVLKLAYPTSIELPSLKVKDNGDLGADIKTWDSTESALSDSTSTSGRSNNSTKISFDTLDIEKYSRSSPDERNKETQRKFPKILTHLLPSIILFFAWLCHVPLGPLGYEVFYKFECTKANASFIDSLSGPYSSFPVAYFFFGISVVICYTTSLLLWPSMRNGIFRVSWICFCTVVVLTFPFGRMGEDARKPSALCADLELGSAYSAGGESLEHVIELMVRRWLKHWNIADWT